jgi:hemoglobin-like flavoprotein
MSSMGEWWHDLWNDPMRENPWAFGMLVLILAALSAALEIGYRWKRDRRRKQETMNDPTSPDPIRMPNEKFYHGGEVPEQPPSDGWVMSADDKHAAERDKAAAEEAIAAARVDELGRPLDPTDGTVFEDEQDRRRYVFSGGAWHEVPYHDPDVALAGPPPGAEDLRDVQSYGRSGDEVQVVTREPGEESRRLATLMQTDPRLIADPLGAPIELPVERLTDDQGRALRDIRDGEYGEVVLAGPQPGRNILAGAPVTASAPVPAPIVRVERETCPHCEGTGYMPSISDNLRASIALVGDSGAEIVKAFYAELLSVAPGLADLFPADLLTTDATKGQRDKLLKALIALSDLYDPADTDKMARLDTALKSFGRSHAAFARPDGTVRGATWEEYAAVKEVLFRTLVAAAGTGWRAEWTESWSQAYDYAAAVMLTEQYRSGFSAPRFPRA